ncbi:MAG: hypothetical protein ACRES9_09540 [Gammaproteobacteria bacterium]
MSEYPVGNEADETEIATESSHAGRDRIPVLTERVTQTQEKPEAHGEELLAANDTAASGGNPPARMLPLDDEEIAEIAERAVEEIRPRLRSALAAALEAHLVHREENTD